MASDWPPSAAHRPLGLHVGSAAENYGLAFIIFGYLLYYAWLISLGHGVPYVMDNNETFSAINHAANLFRFDFFRSWGLADEVSSPLTAAHPFVHTHQGDFPRLWSFLLYCLGARSVEVQIWITTLTIGLASIIFAYRFFCRVGGVLFSVVAVTILVTDYLMFAQWQINVYRVWQCFFLFAALLSVHKSSQWSKPAFISTTLILYSALYYWEIIFALFVSVTVGLYALWIYRSNPRHVLTIALAQISGAVLGFCIFASQSVLYLGWHDFITDINLTYGARNFAEKDSSSENSAAVL